MVGLTGFGESTEEQHAAGARIPNEEDVTGSACEDFPPKILENATMVTTSLLRIIVIRNGNL